MSAVPWHSFDMPYVRSMSTTIFPPKSLQIHCSHHTTCSRRCVMALMESGKDFEYVNVDMAKGEHKSAAFLKMQPFGKVPVLKEGDDFVLFESRAIMKYVLAGTSLCPGDAKEAALVESAISVEYSYFSPAFLPAYYQRVVRTEHIHDYRYPEPLGPPNPSQPCAKLLKAYRSASGTLRFSRTPEVTQKNRAAVTDVFSVGRVRVAI